MGPVLLIESPRARFRMLDWGLREFGATTVVVPGHDGPIDPTLLTPPAIVMNTEAEFTPRRLMTDALRVLAPHSSVVELVPDVEAFEATDADFYLFEPYNVRQLVDWIESVSVPSSTAAARADLRERARRAREATQRLRAQSAATRHRSAELHRATAIWERMSVGAAVL